MNYITEIPNDKTLRVIDFCADWCQHCRELSPRLEQAEKENPSVVFSKIDVDKASNELLDMFNVDELPLIVAVKNGKEISRYDEKDGTIESWCKYIQW